MLANNCSRSDFDFCVHFNLILLTTSREIFLRLLSTIFLTTKWIKKMSQTVISLKSFFLHHMRLTKLVTSISISNLLFLAAACPYRVSVWEHKSQSSSGMHSLVSIKSVDSLIAPSRFLVSWRVHLSRLSSDHRFWILIIEPVQGPLLCNSKSTIP